MPAAKAKAVDEILNEIADNVTDAKAMLLSKENCIVNREHILELLDAAMDNLPDDITQARNLIQTKEKILSDANARAERILSEAREEAKRLVDTHEITIAANKHAHDIIADCEAQVRDLKQEAIHYVMDQLSSAATTIEASLNEIKDLRNKMKTEEQPKASKQRK